MRKGDDGWKINTRFFNRGSNEAIYSHYVTTYEKKDGNWSEKDTFFITPSINSDQTSEVEITEHGNKYEIQTGKRELNIKVPSESWYKSKDYLFIYRKKVSGGGPSHAPREYLNETFKERRFWSGIWVEDSSHSSSWIFQDIEVFIEEKKYSKFFCKNGDNQANDCWQNKDNLQTRIYKKSDSTPDGEKGTWGYADNTHGTQESGDTATLSNKVKPIIEKIQDSKGKWVDTKAFCNYGYERNISNSQLKDLQLFCSTKKK